MSVNCRLFPNFGVNFGETIMHKGMATVGRWDPIPISIYLLSFMVYGVIIPFPATCEATISRLSVISLAGCRRIESVILTGLN